MTARDIAIQKAKRSVCPYKVSAIGLDKHGSVIGSAFNRPLQSGRQRPIHAEMALMARYKRALRTIIICRVGSSGNILPIDPCPVCARKARELGIKIVSIRAQ